MLYLIKPEEIKTLPVGTVYRELSSRTDLLNGCHCIESKTVLNLSLLTKGQKAIIGTDEDIKNCITEFTTVKPDTTDADFQAEQTVLIDKYYAGAVKAEQLKAASLSVLGGGK
jgi:hypothetical protein